MLRGKVLRAYRDLLQEKTFVVNAVMLKEYVEQIRNGFNMNRHVSSDTEIQELIRCACIVSEAISTKFFQVEVNESGALDIVMLRESVKEILERFNKNRNVNPDTFIRETLEHMRTNFLNISAKIVQGEPNESGGPDRLLEQEQRDCWSDSSDPFCGRITSESLSCT